MSREHVHRSSVTSLRRSSLVSGVFETAASRIFPIDADIDLDLDATISPPRASIDHHHQAHSHHSDYHHPYFGSIQEPLMGRVGNAGKNLEGKTKGLPKRIINNTSLRTTTRKSKPHYQENSPSFYRRDYQGGLQRAPVSAHSMEFLRGIYAFMQVSRSSAHHVKTDSAVFRLHTNATVILLVTFSIAVTTRQYVGNPIDCVHTRDIPEDVLNTYCWIHSTYTVVDAFMKKQGLEVPFPGIDNSQGGRGPLTIKHNKYYQWVAFTLFFQAILFYTPRWLWKSWEGGKIHALMLDLDIGICSEIEKRQKKKLLLDYLWDNLRYHNWWAYRYYVCELLALLNVVAQMFLMNKFFDGEFMTFGLDVIAHMEADQEDRMDPMIYIFPRMTKCTFYKYGVSGEVERHDAICILPLNVVNEKIYIFLWFWFILLFILTSLTLIYRVVIIFSPRMRVYLLRLRFRLVRRDAIEIIVRRSKMGDWFLLYMLGENIDTVIFRDIMQELSNRLSQHQHHHVPGMKGEIQDA
ncbi:innexin shaking-B isoform X1 [Sitodiplosis mosellana]|uniref:innexin shaking-B isoform X1 n=2 Tax=Sitodiplosis mosellana TaxID=263140 RepID=UPI00244404F7|nr:innexin shaking-B isoform X1 [Sitodiplosis mosellana]